MTEGGGEGEKGGHRDLGTKRQTEVRKYRVEVTVL